MENNKETEKKGKKTLKTLAIVAITVGVCYEIFGRKGQDFKNACSWVKGKIQSKQNQPQPKPAGGNWKHGKN